jgi:hypothetical protein
MISMSNQISVKEALRLISKGQFSSQMEVTFEGVDGIEALDAVALGEAGVDVPEHLIFYDDSTIVDDEAFDGPWEKIDSDIEEEAKYLQIEMKLDPEIRNWINSNRIDVNSLVKKLLEDAYHTAKLMQK